MAKKSSTPALPAPEIKPHWPKRSETILPLAEIRPSPHNPRKTFDPAKIKQLAESIRGQGLINALVVRPLGDKAEWKQGQWIGVEAWELIAGERRLRACQSIGYAEVAVTVIPLTDVQAKEMMLIDNDQRDDVLPSEQAAAYRNLADEIGAEAVAQRTSKPVSEVRDLIRLAKLPVWCLAAVDAGTLSRSTAAVVARVPGEQARERAAAQSLGCYLRSDEKAPTGAKLAKAVAEGLDRENVWTHREAKERIRREYCRELKGSPFDRKSLTLVAEAGSCDACPKRAGNDPDLVADGVREDICTDTDCYASKVEAWKKDAIEKAVANGALPVPDSFEWPEYSTSAPKGWAELDRKIEQWAYDPLGKELADAGHVGKTIRSLLPKGFEPVHVTLNGDKLVHLAKATDVRASLIESKKLKKGKLPAKKSKTLSEVYVGWDIEERLGLLVARSARDKVAQAANLKDGLLLVAKALVRQSGGGTELWEDLDPAGFVPTLDNSLSQMKPAELLGWIVGAVASGLWNSYNPEEKQFREQVIAFAGYGADDLASLRKLAVDSLKEESKSPKKGAAA